jgi:hypothetical protein
VPSGDGTANTNTSSLAHVFGSSTVSSGASLPRRSMNLSFSSLASACQRNSRPFGPAGIGGDSWP